MRADSHRPTHISRRCATRDVFWAREGSKHRTSNGACGSSAVACRIRGEKEREVRGSQCVRAGSVGLLPGLRVLGFSSRVQPCDCTDLAWNAPRSARPSHLHHREVESRCRLFVVLQLASDMVRQTETPSSSFSFRSFFLTFFGDVFRCVPRSSFAFSALAGEAAGR